MRQRTGPARKDLVLVGGGHAHVAVLKSFAMQPEPGVALTLIARDVHTPYSGMLPGFIAGHYSFDETHIDLGPLARFADARLVHDQAIGLDLDERLVRFADRPPVVYDLLSINIGSSPGVSLVEGASEHAIPVKPIDRFIPRWQALVEDVLRAEGPVRIGTIGAGAGGVELTLAAQYRLSCLLRERGGDPGRLSFHLVTSAPTVLPTHNERVRNRFARILRERGIDVRTGQTVVRATAEGIHCQDGSEIALDHMFWVTAAQPAEWPGASGLDVDQSGFIRVDETLRSTSDESVFAVGDIAQMESDPREKAGVFAVRQGPAVAKNLRHALRGEPLEPFRPQRKFLSLISTGDRNAVASRGNWTLRGRWVWHWKDWIDRRFMDKYNQLPDMEPDVGPDGEAEEMRCGGCGAKVASPALKRALSRLDTESRHDIVVGIASGDDAAVIDVPAGQRLVQSVDYFRAFIDDPYVFGRIAANHALGDIYAMGAEPQSALAIATVPFGPEAKVEETLYQMLAGAVETLGEAGTALAGGHSGEGTELGLGFSVNGFIAPGDHLSKGGMRAGERLILTKPLGTGALFAADMRMKAKGRWIEEALSSMVQSNRDAARILSRHQASAATDVTGFGLAGHLLEMVKASDIDAVIDLDALPVLAGAGETIANGIVSSLQDANRRSEASILANDSMRGHSNYALLFDPQTAGGLLASVPPENADACLEELRQSNAVGSRIIGQVNGNEVEDGSRNTVRFQALSAGMTDDASSDQDQTSL